MSDAAIHELCNLAFYAMFFVYLGFIVWLITKN